MVRGPDPLWGGDIHDFHPPAGVFAGVIGGPPCKGESKLAALNGTPGATLAPEFIRVCEEAGPAWWVMEAVIKHDIGTAFALSPRWLGEKQRRRRFFHSNFDLLPHIDFAVFENPVLKLPVLANHGAAIGSVYRSMAKYTWAEACDLQGLPVGYDLPGFTRVAAREAVGNGVPMGMGRAIAKAVKAATSQSSKDGK